MARGCRATAALIGSLNDIRNHVQAGGSSPPDSRRPQGRTTRLQSATARSVPAFALAGFLLVAGLAHFVIPRPYRHIVPRFLGDPSFWVNVSGIGEIGCAALVACPRTRRLGACAAAVLFVAVFPANVQMALDGGLPGERFPWSSPAVAWLRLPLQVPLIGWALRVSRNAGASAGGSPRASAERGHGAPR